MNKLSLLLAVAILGVVATAEARHCRRGCAPRVACAPCKERCVQPKPSPCAEPQVTEKRWIVQEPCRKLICVEGTCDHEVVERCVTTQSKNCVSPCRVSCPNAVDQENQGGAAFEGTAATSADAAREVVIH
jgi:hypothetical protein